MAVHKGQEAFKTFMAGVLGTIADPTQRAAAEASMNGVLANETLARALYDGVAGQSEISRQLQDLTSQREALEQQQADLEARDRNLQTWHQNLTDWHTQHRELIAKSTRPGNGNGAGQGNPNPPAPAPQPPAVPENVVTRDQAAEIVQTQNAAFLGFQRDFNLIQREHYGKFNEIIDLEPLIQHPQIAALGLKGVYELVHKDRLAAHAKTTTEAAEAKIRADERSKVLAEQAQMPYPSPTGVGSGSPLDALTVNKPDALTDQATAHYHRLQQERQAGAAR